MSERSRRMRRQISDATDDFSDPSEQESGDDFDPKKVDGLRRPGKNEPAAGANSSPSSRSKRHSAQGTSPSYTSKTAIAAGDDRRQSIKLTMKVAPSKLREVMRANEVEALQDVLGGGKVLDGPRSTRRAAQARASVRAPARPKYAEYGESDIEDDDEREDAAAVVDGSTANDFDELGAEAEGGTEDEDVEMEDATPVKKAPVIPKAPKITLKTPAKSEPRQTSKAKIVVTPADVGRVKPVEDQEMEDDVVNNDVEDTSELSEGDDDDDVDEDEDEEEEEDDQEDDEEEEEEEDEEDDEEEGDQTNLTLGEVVARVGLAQGERPATGIDEDDEDELGNSDGESLGSGEGTPDPGKLTNRQRGRPGEALMALDMAPQQRKFFTDQEKAMKKDEHARKRKELTKRKTQEEKTAALNRLLKPQVSKTRGAAPKADTLAAQLQAATEEEEIVARAEPLYTTWISTKDGIKLGVPDEWLGKKVGKYFGLSSTPSNKRLIQEVE